MNQVLLIGNLASDPEIETPGGISQVRLNLACTRSVPTPDGPRDRVTWVEVLAYHELAHSLGTLGSDSRLLVHGRLETALHDDGEVCFNYLEVVADEVELLSVKEPSRKSSAHASAPLRIQR
jgi:single-stranded DNA-binding protein